MGLQQESKVAKGPQYILQQAFKTARILTAVEWCWISIVMDVGSFARTSIKRSFNCLLEKRWIEIISSFQKLKLTFTFVSLLLL